MMWKYKHSDPTNNDDDLHERRIKYLLSVTLSCTHRRVSLPECVCVCLCVPLREITLHLLQGQEFHNTTHHNQRSAQLSLMTSIIILYTVMSVNFI